MYYYRSLAEPELPFTETVLTRQHLVVADNTPLHARNAVWQIPAQHAVVRLKRELGLPELSPPCTARPRHGRAGDAWSAQQNTRELSSLVSRPQITKQYDAIAPWRADLALSAGNTPAAEESPQFFRMHEVPGEPNSRTTSRCWRSRRLGRGPLPASRPSPANASAARHMSALGLPLRNDPFYPVVNDPQEGDYSRPLQLLARSLNLRNPLSGVRRVFESRPA